jgi:hypothetical protein
MSTTIHSVVLNGWEAELVKMTKPEKRFNLKTGKPEPDEMVLDVFSLRVNDIEIARAENKWELEVKGLDIHRLSNQRIFVGRTLTSLVGYEAAGTVTIDPFYNNGMDNLKSLSGVDPQLHHLIFTS